MLTTSELIRFLENSASLLDRWAEESLRGGWSTHQVEPNRGLANDMRRMASRVRDSIHQNRIGE